MNRWASVTVKWHTGYEQAILFDLDGVEDARITMDGKTLVDLVNTWEANVDPEKPEDSECPATTS